MENNVINPTLKKYKEEFKEKEFQSIVLLPEEEDDYELKLLGNKKKHQECFYFTKKEFEQYQEDHEARVIGNVYIDQKRYKDPEKAKDVDKAYENKRKKKIIGKCKLRYSDEYIEKKEKSFEEHFQEFDLYKPENKKCVGYAWVGQKQYVRLVKRNPLVIIIPIFLIIALMLGLTMCKNPDTEEPWIDTIGDLITDIGGSSDNDEEMTYSDIWTWVKPGEVSAENKTIPLRNEASNEVWMCYDIYKDGELLHSTGAFLPGYQVDCDFYTLLNGEKGTHELTLFIKLYDLETKEAYSTSTMDVEIIVS